VLDDPTPNFFTVYKEIMLLQKLRKGIEDDRISPVASLRAVGAETGVNGITEFPLNFPQEEFVPVNF